MASGPSSSFARPFAAESLRSFWRRWNLTVQHFLREHCYHPDRWGRTAAGAVTFLGSAALHAFPMVLAGKARLVPPMVAFFLAQPALLAAER